MGTLKPGNLVGAKSHRFLSERWGLMVLTFAWGFFYGLVFQNKYKDKKLIHTLNQRYLKWRN